MAKAPGYMVAAAALWAAAASGAGLATVAQRGRAFAVPGVQIARGDTVRFVNEDTFLHQVFVQSPGFSYESDEQEPGQAVDVRFTSAGTFTVRCQSTRRWRCKWMRADPATSSGAVNGDQSCPTPRRHCEPASARQSRGHERDPCRPWIAAPQGRLAMTERSDRLGLRTMRAKSGGGA